jgi:hypothetical protein
MGRRHQPMRHNRGRLPPGPCQPPVPRSTGQRADGLKRLSGRTPARPGPPNPSSCDRAPQGSSPRA